MDTCQVACGHVSGDTWVCVRGHVGMCWDTHGGGQVAGDVVCRIVGDGASFVSYLCGM